MLLLMMACAGPPGAPPVESDTDTDTDTDTDADTDTDSDSDSDSDSGAPPLPLPELETVDAVTLPLPTAVGLPPVQGFTVNARVHPHGLPATWHVEYGATAAYGQTAPARALPGRLEAHFEEDFASGSAGWQAGMSGQQLTRFATGGPKGGPFVRYTDDQGYGDDTNHYEGIGAIHLGPYAYVGNYTGALPDGPPLYLGGGFPDLRGARFEAWLRGVGWDARGTELGTWIQGARDPSVVDLPPYELRFPNWAHTGEPQGFHLQSGAWEAAAWTLRNRSADWTFAGTYGGRMTYDYGELDALLSAVNVDLFALQVLYVDIFDEPSGSWDLAGLHITYRQHSVCAASNGGALVAAPPGGTGEAFLTDGWRHGAGREWQSPTSPAWPVELEYAFAVPITLWNLTVHNATVNPARQIEVAVSSDGGATWNPVAAGELAATHPLGPNHNFLHADAWTLVGGVAVWEPLHPVPVDRLRVTVLSGWEADGVGLGEIEAFGAGAVEATDDDWYDVTRDILVDPGTWHYRVVATTDGGVVAGPDQLVVVP